MVRVCGTMHRQYASVVYGAFRFRKCRFIFAHASCFITLLLSLYISKSHEKTEVMHSPGILQRSPLSIHMAIGNAIVELVPKHRGKVLSACDMPLDNGTHCNQVATVTTKTKTCDQAMKAYHPCMSTILR